MCLRSGREVDGGRNGQQRTERRPCPLGWQAPATGGRLPLGEATVIARVGEGIVAAIGKAETHRAILERPEIISQAILARGLDSATCFEILSVDIADVDVLDNVAARLQTVRADADKRIARARSEERRAAAIATHQEMQSRTVGMEVKVTAAKAELPLAVANACQDQNLGSPLPFRHLLPSPRRWQSSAQPT